MTFYKRSQLTKYNLPISYSKLSQEDRYMVREQYQETQKNVCIHCGSLLTDKPSKEFRNKYISKDLFPEGFFNNPVHLHHDHNTDMTIGAVHAHCNAVLWQYYGE